MRAINHGHTGIDIVENNPSGNVTMQSILSSSIRFLRMLYSLTVEEDKAHKPLILEGARQVGKTWLMKEFGKTQYKNVAYINFDSNEKMCKVFETDLDTNRLITAIGLDAGLLGALVNLDAKTILDKYEMFQELKGAITEQYVLQQFKTIKDLPIFYWTNETSRSEVDFVIQIDSNVVPVEVKAATNLKARSLKIYMEQFKPNYAIRTSMADYKRTENLVDLPLYAIESIKEEL